MFKTIKFEEKDNIGILTISRPKALNALNTEFFNDVNILLDDLEKNETIRVLIITGEGKAFVAGADIAEMSNFDTEQAHNFSVTGQKTFERIENLPFPVIAAINGFALGGGMELSMACDIRIASEKAKLGQPEVNLGLIPGYAGTQRLTRLAGMGNALYILLSGEMITAQQAYNFGLVQQVTDAEKLMETALNLAKIIASKGKNAVRQTKYVARKGIELSFAQGQALEANIFGSLFETEETKEGIKAFLEKRKPNW